MACALAIAGNISVRPSASGRASALSKNRRLDFEDKIDIVARSPLKPVSLDVCVLIGDIFLSDYANGAWMNNLFMVGASKNTT
jgi:hypothetical protein